MKKRRLSAKWPVVRAKVFCLQLTAWSLFMCAFPVVAWGQVTTTTTLTVTSGGSGVSMVNSGSVVTLTAAVQSGGSAVKPGVVNFCDAAAASCTAIHLLGTAQLTSNGTAVIRIMPSVGSHSYKAVFMRQKTLAASASSVSTLTVTGRQRPGIAIVQSPDSLTSDEPPKTRRSPATSRWG